MENRKKYIIIKWLRIIFLILLLIITSSLFVFSLLSGAEKYGGGFSGIIKNLPNALPWLALYIFIFVVLKWELVGGIIIISFGIFSTFFFNVLKGNTFVLFFTVLPLILSGIIFIYHWYLKKNIIDKE